MAENDIARPTSDAEPERGAVTCDHEAATQIIHLANGHRMKWCARCGARRAVFDHLNSEWQLPYGKRTETASPLDETCKACGMKRWVLRESACVGTPWSEHVCGPTDEKGGSHG